MSVIIWHNPRCSKSRQTLELLRENGVDPVVIDYQKTPPGAQDLRAAIDALGGNPVDLVRTNEAAFKEQGLSKDSDAETLIAAMVATPKLIQRPLVLNGPKAAIGRPPENVLAIL